MQINATLRPADRAEWRGWLERYHRAADEIWLVLAGRPGESGLPYLDAVEEALCFGWIDSVAKRLLSGERAQRFTPRQRRSNWTELNKERARRLIRLGLMTDAGRAALPDLEALFPVAADIAQAIQAAPGAWAHFEAYPDLYRRVRVGYIEEARRNHVEFERRLRNFVTKTASNRVYGNWNDGGKLG
jgi:uncharacterized protein YdeI (YjbR/CyaY-like superfamily)